MTKWILWMPAMLLLFSPADAYFSKKQICRATIAAIMGHDVSIVRVDYAGTSQINLSYTRDSDGKKWAFKCRVSGSRISWGNADGRWRNHEYDSKISFADQGDKLLIIEDHGDGSKSRMTFSKDDLSD